MSLHVRTTPTSIAKALKGKQEELKKGILCEKENCADATCFGTLSPSGYW
jgi:hypothetical protein